MIHTCHICDFKTEGKGKLTAHITAVHEGLKKFQCDNLLLVVG